MIQIPFEIFTFYKIELFENWSVIQLISWTSPPEAPNSHAPFPSIDNYNTIWICHKYNSNGLVLQKAQVSASMLLC